MKAFKLKHVGGPYGDATSNHDRIGSYCYKYWDVRCGSPMTDEAVEIVMERLEAKS